MLPKVEVIERAPEPTAAPRLAGIALDRLYGRQVVGDVCGYASGIATESVYCAEGYECAQNTVNNVRGCCSPPIEFCTLPTACVNFADLSTACNELCSLNPYTLQCIEPAFPYCITWTWNLGSGSTQSQFKCTDTDGLIANHLNVSPSLAPGQTVTGAVATALSGAVQTNEVISSTSNSQAAAAATSSPSTSSQLPTASFGTNNGGGSSNTNDNAQTVNASGGLSQAATIAIAVVVTVVGLATLGLVAFCLWWRRRKLEHRAALDAAQTNTRMSYAPSSGYHPPTSSGGGAGYRPMEQGHMPPPEHVPYDQGPHHWDSPSQVGAPFSGQAVAGAGGYHGVFEAPGQKDGPSQWSELDDDQLARNRRFSGEGTVVTNDVTVAGRTDDGFRPQGA